MKHLSDKTISILIVFYKTGRLKAVHLNADNDRDQATLERCMRGLFKSNYLGWLKRLFIR